MYEKQIKYNFVIKLRFFKRDSLPQENFQMSARKKYFYFLNLAKPNFIVLNSRNIGHAGAHSFSSQLFTAKARLRWPVIPLRIFDGQSGARLHFSEHFGVQRSITVPPLLHICSSMIWRVTNGHIRDCNSKRRYTIYHEHNKRTFSTYDKDVVSVAKQSRTFTSTGRIDCNELDYNGHSSHNNHWRSSLITHLLWRWKQ